MAKISIEFLAPKDVAASLLVYVDQNGRSMIYGYYDDQILLAGYRDVEQNVEYHQVLPGQEQHVGAFLAADLYIELFYLIRGLATETEQSTGRYSLSVSNLPLVGMPDVSRSHCNEGWAKAWCKGMKYGTVTLIGAAASACCVASGGAGCIVCGAAAAGSSAAVSDNACCGQ